LEAYDSKGAKSMTLMTGTHIHTHSWECMRAHKRITRPTRTHTNTVADASARKKLEQSHEVKALY
jgi:hypothetical protein